MYFNSLAFLLQQLCFNSCQKLIQLYLNSPHPQLFCCSNFAQDFRQLDEVVCLSWMVLFLVSITIQQFYGYLRQDNFRVLGLQKQLLFILWQFQRSQLFWTKSYGRKPDSGRRIIDVAQRTFYSFTPISLPFAF